MADRDEIACQDDVVDGDPLVIMDDIDWTQTLEIGQIEQDGSLKLSPRLCQHLGVGSDSPTSLLSFTTPRGILLMSRETFLDAPADRLGNRSIHDLTREELVESGRETRRLIVALMDADR